MKIKEFAQVINGSTPSSKNPQYYDGDIVWFTPKDLATQNKKYVSVSERTISEKGYKSCSTSMLPPGSVLMSSRAPIGLLAITTVPCCTNQGFKSFILDTEKCNPEYLYYYLKYHIKEIESLGSGTTFKEVSKPSIEEYEVDLPSLEKQKKTIEILSIIDSKIQNNNKQIQTLESLAKTIYDYWFVQFDFPNEDGKPYKSSGGKMVWNEELKREIPEGWKVKSISEFDCYTSDFTANGSFAGLAENVIYNNTKDYARLIRIVDVPNDFVPEKSIYIDKKGYDYLKSCQLFGGEIIICNVGNAGFIFRCPFLNEKMVLGPNGIVLKKEDFENFLYMYFSDQIGQHQIRTISSGSIQLKFNKTNFRKLKLFLPPIHVNSKFNLIYKDIESKRNCLWKENNELKKIKDFLLPLLMNGQVHV